MNVLLPLRGYRYLKLIIKEVDMEKDHHPLLLFHFYLCFLLENSAWLTHESYVLIVLLTG